MIAKSLEAIVANLFLLLCVICLLAILGQNLWVNQLNSRCRTTQVPLSGVWEVTSQRRICSRNNPCGPNEYCGSNYDYADEISGDLSAATDIVQLNYGITNFDFLQNTYLTLFQLIMIEDWPKLAQMMADANGKLITYFYIVMYILVCSYFILNLIVSIFYSTWSEQFHKDQKENEVQLTEQIQEDIFMQEVQKNKSLGALLGLIHNDAQEKLLSKSNGVQETLRHSTEKEDPATKRIEIDEKERQCLTKYIRKKTQMLMQHTIISQEADSSPQNALGNQIGQSESDSPKHESISINDETDQNQLQQVTDQQQLHSASQDDQLRSEEGRDESPGSKPSQRQCANDQNLLTFKDKYESEQAKLRPRPNFRPAPDQVKEDQERKCSSNNSPKLVPLHSNGCLASIDEGEPFKMTTSRVLTKKLPALLGAKNQGEQAVGTLLSIKRNSMIDVGQQQQSKMSLLDAPKLQMGSSRRLKSKYVSAQAHQLHVPQLPPRHLKEGMYIPSTCAHLATRKFCREAGLAEGTMGTGNHAAPLIPCPL